MKKRLVVGPSHIKRWVQSIDCAIIPKPKNVDFHGAGGAPIWGEFIKNKKKDFNLYDEIIFIVGDFRFGNKTLDENESGKSHHGGIVKELINDENDKIMYQKVIYELMELAHSSYKSKLRFIFWDLALSEDRNKRINKYFNEGVYSHPIWNLDQVQHLFPKNTIAIDSNLNLESLYIDNSNHPSFLGYCYLYYLILDCEFKGKPIDIYADYRLTARKIIGDSTLIKHINQFCEKGILDSSYHLEEITLSQLDMYLSRNNFDITFVSNLRYQYNNTSHVLVKIKELYELKIKYGSRFNVVFWEAFTQEVISTREPNNEHLLPDNPLFFCSNMAGTLVKNSVYPSVDSLSAQSLVELNILLQPTMKAILWLFMCHDSQISLLEFEKYYFAFRRQYFNEID